MKPFTQYIPIIYTVQLGKVDVHINDIGTGKVALYKCTYVSKHIIVGAYSNIIVGLKATIMNTLI